MAIHVGHYDEQSVEEFLNEINFEKILKNFELIEPVAYVAYGHEVTYHDSRLNASVITDGKELMNLMDQSFDNLTNDIKPEQYGEKDYGAAA